MTLESFLLHTCTIQRDDSPSQDTYGGETMSWSNLHTDLDCRLITRYERIASSGIGFQVITTYTLVIPANKDVTTKDRVLSVTLEDASSLGPFDINSVVPRRDGRGQRLVALDLDLVE